MSTADVEMKDVASVVTADSVPDSSVAIKSNVKIFLSLLAHLSDHRKDSREVHRVVRKYFTSLRKARDLAFSSCLSLSLPLFSVSAPAAVARVADELRPELAHLPSGPEVLLFCRLCELEHICSLPGADASLLSSASRALFALAQAEQRRALSALVSRCMYYVGRGLELSHDVPAGRELFLSALRTAELRQDDETCAVVLNELLRGYVFAGRFDLADRLYSAAALSEDRVSSNQVARLRLYQGWTKAMRLNYTGAHDDLQEALRRAPQSSLLTRGFRLRVTKLLLVVQILLGDIPERAAFTAHGTATALRAYLACAVAVRAGDVVAFERGMGAHAAQFEHDGTLSLWRRVRQNVIKAGLRRISLAYSRITLEEIARKLALSDAGAAEWVVAKAVRDGVMDAALEKDGVMRSKEVGDVYATQEPQQAYHMRTLYCLKVYNEAVAALRFPDEKEERVGIKEAAQEPEPKPVDVDALLDEAEEDDF